MDHEDKMIKDLLCRACLTRRKLLGLGAQTLSIAALSTPILAVLNACGQSPLSPPTGNGNGVTGGTPTTSTSTQTDSSGKTFSIKFSDHPELQNVGGSTLQTLRTSAGDLSVYVTRVSASAVVTVSTVCTHEGFMIDAYDASSQSYMCELHGSEFHADGSVKRGPASSSLPTYVSKITDAGVDVIVS